ncbi:MAG: hypothetical protein U9N35_03335, partial [Euryarchaeota archaeon]|nr:hypothetical protein [Euryarchaeota archaeon]
HTIEVGVSNIGLLDAHNVSLKINAPEGMKIEISPKSTTIERFSVEIFTVQVMIDESVEPGNYTLVIRTKGSFATDSSDLTIYVK